MSLKPPDPLRVQNDVMQKSTRGFQSDPMTLPNLTLPASHQSHCGQNMHFFFFLVPTEVGFGSKCSSSFCWHTDWAVAHRLLRKEEISFVSLIGLSSAADGHHFAKTNHQLRCAGKATISEHSQGENPLDPPLWHSPAVPTFTLETFSQCRGGFAVSLPLAEAAHRGCGAALCCVHSLLVSNWPLSHFSLFVFFIRRGPIKNPEDPSALLPLCKVTGFSVIATWISRNWVPSGVLCRPYMFYISQLWNSCYCCKTWNLWVAIYSNNSHLSFPCFWFSKKKLRELEESLGLLGCCISSHSYLLPSITSL